MEDNSPEARAKRKAEWRAKDIFCKSCLKEPKRNGSKFCQKCSDKYKKDGRK